MAAAGAPKPERASKSQVGGVFVDDHQHPTLDVDDDAAPLHWLDLTQLVLSTRVVDLGESSSVSAD